MFNCTDQTVCDEVDEKLKELSYSSGEGLWQPKPDPTLYKVYPAQKDARLYTLWHKLDRIYHEELKESLDRGSDTCSTSYLLAKLVQKGKYNQVVITLYPVTEGFTISYLSGKGAHLIKDSKYPYTHDTLLDYVDKGQLPTPFLEYWEESVPQLFYDGCVICQVRDLRHGPPASVEYVLLRPHNHSIIGDVNNLLKYSTDIADKPLEEFKVESYVIGNANRSICLDPSPDTGRRLLKLYRDANAFNTAPIRKMLYRNSPLFQYRKRKYEHLLPKGRMFLYDFINTSKSFVDEEIEERPPSQKPKETNECKISVPSYLPPRDACRCVRCKFSGMAPLKMMACGVCHVGDLCRCEYEVDDFTPRVVTEWLLENRVETTTRHVRLTLMNRPVNFEYLAQIYMDNKYVEGISDGTNCRFTLGSWDHAHRFVRQYFELYTAEGRQKVNITQLGPGHIVK